MDSSPSAFWNWFKENNKTYLFLNSVDEDVKEKLMNNLLFHLNEYCENIYFEIGGHPNGDQELIITAEGDRNYFGKVDQLISSAPLIDNWTFFSLIPPVEGHFKSKWDDLELNTEDLWFLPLSIEESDDLGIRIFIKNHDLIKENKILMSLLYKMLDSIVGEKSFALDIQYVDAELQPDDPEEEGMYQLLELPEYIKWRKTNRKNTL
jgi:hypothetical protein